MVKALIGEGCTDSFLLLLDPVHRVVNPADPLIQITEQEMVRGHKFIVTCNADDPGRRDDHDAGDGVNQESNKDVHVDVWSLSEYSEAVEYEFECQWSYQNFVFAQKGTKLVDQVLGGNKQR